MRAPRTDEYSIGVDREVGRRLAVAIAYVRKDGSQLHRLDGCRRSVSRGNADAHGRPERAGARARQRRRPLGGFCLTNPEGYSMSYNGLVMAARKAPLARLAGVRLIHAVEGIGLQASSGASRRRRRRSAQSPARLSGRSGRIQTRSPMRAAGCRTIVRTCFVSWAALTCLGLASSLRPICSTSAASHGRPQRRSCCRRADQRILLEPRGSRRLSAQSLLDLRLSRTIAAGGIGRIELLVDLLNVLNDNAEEGIATDNLFSPNFGQSSVFIDPRRAMVSMRLNLGR